MEHKNALNRQLCTSVRAFTDSVTKSEREHISIQLIKKYPCLKSSVGAGHVSEQFCDVNENNSVKEV